jgi:predicted transcriptional regulator
MAATAAPTTAAAPNCATLAGAAAELVVVEGAALVPVVDEPEAFEELRNYHQTPKVRCADRNTHDETVEGDVEVGCAEVAAGEVVPAAEDVADVVDAGVEAEEDVPAAPDDDEAPAGPVVDEPEDAEDED